MGMGSGIMYSGTRVALESADPIVASALDDAESGDPSTSGNVSGTTPAPTALVDFKIHNADGSAKM
jgi:hypothetical protein